MVGAAGADAGAVVSISSDEESLPASDEESAPPSRKWRRGGAIRATGIGLKQYLVGKGGLKDFRPQILSPRLGARQRFQEMPFFGETAAIT